MNIAYLGLGSNLNNPSAQLNEAIKTLKLSYNIQVLKISSFYQTKPWGVINQPDFINAVIKISTDLAPDNLLNLINNIEENQGRIREQKWGPRIIDIDILLYDQQIINSEKLTIPHQELKNRKFVLEPLIEIEPDLILPCGSNLKDLLKNSE